MHPFYLTFSPKVSLKSWASQNLVEESLPATQLTALGLQHVLVMYAGAVAVQLIVGRALKLSPVQVGMLVSTDLFCCGWVTLIQALGATQWFGIKRPMLATMLPSLMHKVAALNVYFNDARGGTNRRLLPPKWWTHINSSFYS